MAGFCSFVPNSQKHWCYDFKGNYSDCFYIAWICTLIGLANTLVRYPLLATIVEGAQQARKKGTEESGSKASVALKMGSEQTEKMLKENNIGGWTFDQFNILTSIVTICYIIAKILLVRDESLKGANKAYRQITIQNWCTALIIIITYIFAASGYSSFESIKLINQYRKLNNGELSLISKICSVIFFIDVITTIVVMGIKYGFFVYYLYQMAIALLVGLMLGFSICCWAPCVFVFGIGLGLLFKVLSCGKSDSRFGIVMTQISGGITMNLFAYLCLCIVFVFVWLLNGKVPESIVIYQKRDNQENIALVLFIATCIGFISCIGGIFKSCLCPGQNNKEEQISGDYKTFN